MKKPPSTGGELVYAVGDVHGCYDLLKLMLARVAQDFVRRAQGRRPTLVFCGDYVDRGPESTRVIEAMIWLQKREDIELRALKGNHEQALLAFIDDPASAWPWLQFGGVETLAAYGVDPPDQDERDLWRARDDLLDRMPASHLRFLHGLELTAVIGDYAFVHAGIRPGRPLAKQTEDDLLWIRGGFLDVEGPFEKVIVHGHTWIDEQPQLVGPRIGVDTGAYSTGVLTAICLDGEEAEIIQVRRTAQPALMD